MAPNWYLSELVFRIYCEEHPGMHRFDKQLRLIEALSEREAYRKLLHLAKVETERLNNPSLKERLKWEFAGVGLLHNIEVPEDGSELHYSIDEPEDAEEYLRSLKYRNSKIKSDLAITA